MAYLVPFVRIMERILWARHAVVGSLHGVALFLIETVKSTKNSNIESFNRRFRNECLNEHWFTSLYHARVVIEAWRREYNEERPKKGLEGLTPSAYAEQLALKMR